MQIPFKIVRVHPSMISESEKKIEEFLETASHYHVKAATLLNDGEYEKAAQNALLAQKYLNLASETTREKQLPTA